MLLTDWFEEFVDQDDSFELMDSSFDLVTIAGILKRAGIAFSEETYHGDPMLRIVPSYGPAVVEMRFSKDGSLEAIGNE